MCWVSLAQGASFHTSCVWVKALRGKKKSAIEGSSAAIEIDGHPRLVTSHPHLALPHPSVASLLKDILSAVIALLFGVGHGTVTIYLVGCQQPSPATTVAE
ncbi:hypothetical protein HN51_045775 [Arachis hypogaea]